MIVERLLPRGNVGLAELRIGNQTLLKCPLVETTNAIFASVYCTFCVLAGSRRRGGVREGLNILFDVTRLHVEPIKVDLSEKLIKIDEVACVSAGAVEGLLRLWAPVQEAIEKVGKDDLFDLVLL